MAEQGIQRSIDFMCEEERIRRLGERIRRDRDEGSELSRERRARALARELRARGVAGTGHTASPRPVSERVTAAATAVALPAPGIPAALPVPATVAAVRGPPAPAMEEPQAPAASSAAAPAKELSAAAMLDPKDRLNAALDRITVKGIVDFRGITEPVPEVEAVAIAALRLLGSQAEPDAAPLPLPQSWFEVKRALLKPGHFVNALRRFPYAAERGQIPESDLCDVEEVLAEVPPHGHGLEEIHPTAAYLYNWVRAALEYAAWSHARLETVASPARAGALPPRAAVNAGADASGTEARPTWPSPSIAAASASAPAPEARSRASGTAAFSFAEMVADESLGVGDGGASTGGARGYSAGSPLNVLAPVSTVSFGGPPPAPAALPSYSTAGTFGGPATARGGGYDGGASQATVAAVRARSPGATAQPRSPSPVYSRSGVVAASSRPRSMVPLPQVEEPPLRPEEIEENNRQLEQAKKEVREIRSLEAQVKWGMEREEKREVEAAIKEEEDDIMVWREDLAVGMKEIAEEKARVLKIQDLAESKNFQAFKRDRKQVLREEELDAIKEQYQSDMANSEMQADIAKMAVVDRHALVLETLEDIQDQRDTQATEKIEEKAKAEQERTHERRITFHHEANKLATEKEELLRSLQLMRARQKLPVTSNRGARPQALRPR